MTVSLQGGGPARPSADNDNALPGSRGPGTGTHRPMIFVPSILPSSQCVAEVA